jgi:hypothetical protein
MGIFFLVLLSIAQAFATLHNLLFQKKLLEVVLQDEQLKLQEYVEELQE